MTRVIKERYQKTQTPAKFGSDAPTSLYAHNPRTIGVFSDSPSGLYALYGEGFVQEFGRRPTKQAYILVGISAYKARESIGYVVKQVILGLAEYFPEHRSVIMVADNRSFDGTLYAVKQAADSVARSNVTPIYFQPHKNDFGKGYMVEYIFRAAQAYGAQVVIHVDSDLKSIRPDWMEKLARPILEERVDMVTPFYRRDKNDGTITNTFVYPFTRALYGIPVRQPIGGDFAFSRQLVDELLRGRPWNDLIQRFGIDSYETTTAAQKGYKMKEAPLGLKIHKDVEPSKLDPMFIEVVGTVFGLMNNGNQKSWMHSNGGGYSNHDKYPEGEKPKPVAVNFDKLREGFYEGLKEHEEILEFVLGHNFRLVRELANNGSLDSKVFDDETYVEGVHRFALEYNFPRNGYKQKDLLTAMRRGFHKGYLGSFLKGLEDYSPDQAEGRIGRLCGVFCLKKPELVSRWRDRDPNLN